MNNDIKLSLEASINHLLFDNQHKNDFHRTWLEDLKIRTVNEICKIEKLYSEKDPNIFLTESNSLAYMFHRKYLGGFLDIIEEQLKLNDRLDNLIDSIKNQSTEQ